MKSNKDQELIIVNAISQMVIPSDIFEKSEFKEIIKNFKDAQDEVGSSLDAVKSARENVKDGNFLGNWLHNRTDKLQDAQMDLNKSVGLLTRQSSELILFNTAISKVLVSQQKVLHEQQELLNGQATELASQNSSIKNQQIKLSEQQEEIIKANQGLLEAKGLTREQAEKLVGCVNRVEMAEQKMEQSNQELGRSITIRIVEMEGYISAVKTEFEEVLTAEKQKTLTAINTLIKSTNSDISTVHERLFVITEKANSDAVLHASELIKLTDNFSAQLKKLQSQLKLQEEETSKNQETITEIFTAKIEGLESKFNESVSAGEEKNKKLMFASMVVFVIAALSIGLSMYCLLSLK